MYIWIVCWVRAGFRDCLFQGIMVGEPAPTAICGWVGAGFRDCLFQAIMVGEPAPTAF